MRPRLHIAGKTDKGRCRSKNEDFFLVDADLGFMVVADGMGGHAAGEVAAELASTLCTKQLKKSLQTGHVPVFYHVPPKDGLDPRSLILGDCVKFSNQAVYEAAQSSPDKHNMGTTLVAALWLDDRLAVAHVGDSRLYVVHSNRLQQCTTDHSFVQEQVTKGLLKPEEAEKSDLRNMLTRSVGVNENVDVDVVEVPLAQGDFILLCSDGLTKMLDDDQIALVFQNEMEPQKIVDELVRRANEAGGGDNITAVVARVEGEPSTWRSLTDRVKHLWTKPMGDK